MRNRSDDWKDALFYFPFSKSSGYLLRPGPLLSTCQQNLSDSTVRNIEHSLDQVGITMVIGLLSRNLDPGHAQCIPLSQNAYTMKVFLQSKPGSVLPTSQVYYRE